MPLCDYSKVQVVPETGTGNSGLRAALYLLAARHSIDSETPTAAGPRDFPANLGNMERGVIGGGRLELLFGAV